MRLHQDVPSYLRNFAFTIFGGLVLTVLGCGSGADEKPTAQVQGKVTHDGQPVSGGSVTFVPAGGEDGKPGKPASGTVQSDGTYKLSTYGTDDGAVVGKHRVSYSPPTSDAAAPAEGEHGEAPKSPYDGLKPKTAEVEVESGGSTIDIELVPAS